MGFFNSNFWNARVTKDKIDRQLTSQNRVNLVPVNQGLGTPLPRHVPRTASPHPMVLGSSPNLNTSPIISIPHKKGA